MSKEFKLPESVPMLYYYYKVRRVKHLQHNTECVGCVSGDSREIWVDADLDNQEAKEVFWHEALEELLDKLEIKIDHPLYCAFIQGLLPILDAVEAYQEGQE